MDGATIKRDLRTGRSLWADSPGLGVKTRPLTQAISVDVAVVGAGISGAFVAHELARDHTVAVLDRRPPLMGSTLASTAMLQWEIDLPLTTLGGRIGPANARRAYRRSQSAVDALQKIVVDEGIRCGLKPKGSLYLAGDEYGHRALEAEAEARTAMGLKSRYIGPAELREQFGVDRTGAIVSEGRGAGGGQRPRRRDPADRCGSCGARRQGDLLLRL
jgi:glycine/D-amino acid oxidase-like deaminating enzyme